MTPASPLLSWVTFAPFAVALVLVAVESGARLAGRRLPAELWRGAGLAAAVLTLALSLGLWQGFDPAQSGYQFVEHAPWLPQYGIHWFVGIDGISLLLILLTTFLMPVVLVASWHDIERSPRSWVFFMLALETGMLGSFAALNLFQFYLFWELMLIPMYFIIGVWGGARRVYAAVKFFLFTMFGSLLMLVAILVLYVLHHQQFGIWTFDLVTGPGSVVQGLLETKVPTSGIWWQTQTWLFAAFFLAFGVKVPVFPFHTWLPDAHVEAPTAGSVILAGVLLKMGTYGFVRFSLPLFPVAAVEFSPLVFGLALAGILYGALVAMVQKDIKKLVAYSSVAHLGFVMLGMFALNVEGLEGSILQMVNHGISTGALFFLAGMIYERRHSRLIEAYGGLARVVPLFAAILTIVSLSSIALPGTNGFVGEFLVLLGSFRTYPIATALATTGVIVAAAYLLPALQRVIFNPLTQEESKRLPDLTPRELIVLVPLLVCILWIGIYPKPFLRRMEPSARQFIELVRPGATQSQPVTPAGGQP